MTRGRVPAAVGLNVGLAREKRGRHISGSGAGQHESQRAIIDARGAEGSGRQRAQKLGLR